MLIFKSQYEKAKQKKNKELSPEVAMKLEEAKLLVERANEGVLSERSPITLIEKVQVRDTTKMVEKLIIEFSKGKDTKANLEKLDKAMTCLRTSIDNIL